MKKTFTLGTAVIAALLLAGCAKGPDPNSFGSRLMKDGGETAAIGEKWAKGEALIADGHATIADGESDINKGESDISKGESRVSKGKKKVRNGQAQVKEGERLKREAEETYNLRGPAPAAIAPKPTS